MAVALAISGGTQAQIFNMGSNGNGNRNNTEGTSLFGAEGFGSININDGTNNSQAEGFGDQYVSPIGSGLFLLAGMAGAYGLMRRKKNEDQK